MNDATMNKLWNTITDLGNEIVSKIQIGSAPRFESKVKKVFFDTYKKYNARLKDEFMSDPHLLIDRHKIAACVAVSVIIVSPIKNVDKSVNNKITLYYLCNETLAIFSALYIVQYFMLEDSTKKEVLHQKILEDGLVFPKNNGEDYILWLASALSRCNMENANVYIIMLSNILFLIEKYTLLSYSTDNKSCDSE